MTCKHSYRAVSLRRLERSEMAVLDAAGIAAASSREGDIAESPVRADVSQGAAALNV